MMIKNFINKSNPDTIITLDYSEIQWRDRLNQPGALQKFHQEHIELFDDRYFDNLNGSRKTIILENDVTPTDEIIKIAEKVAGKSTNIINATSINPDMLNNIYESEFKPHLRAIFNRAPHNICIDSIFKDRKQFAWMINNFLWTIRDGIKLNYFIVSHGTLLNVLNEEYQKTEVYAYKCVPEGRYKEPGFSHMNHLSKTIELNRVYDISDGMAHHIEFNQASGKFYVQNSYLWDTSKCSKKIDDRDIPEKKSIWE